MTAGISNISRISVKDFLCSPTGPRLSKCCNELEIGDTINGDRDSREMLAGESDMVAVCEDDAESYGPAYSLGSERGGPQCASCNDFCFFCRFSEGKSADANSGGSIIQDFKDMVRQLASERKEVDTIVDALFSAYTEHAQKDVEYVNSDGETITAPTWKKSAIKRHLLFSREFEELFDHSIENIFHSTIYYLNDKLVHRDTRTVEPKTHQMLMETIKTYRAWKKDARAKLTM